MAKAHSKSYRLLLGLSSSVGLGMQQQQQQEGIPSLPPKNPLCHCGCHMHMKDGRSVKFSSSKASYLQVKELSHFNLFFWDESEQILVQDRAFWWGNYSE